MPLSVATPESGARSAPAGNTPGHARAGDVRVRRGIGRGRMRRRAGRGRRPGRSVIQRARGQPVRGQPRSPAGGVGLRPAQPVALLVRPLDRRHRDRRRRPGRGRGGRLRGRAGGAGANFGWNCFEGAAPFAGAPAGCTAPGHVPPAFEYSSASSETRCSITGGYVVRDPSLAAIAGRYVYGDFCTGELRTVALGAGGASDDRALNLTVPAIASFGEDAAGRVYAVSLGGPVLPPARRARPGRGGCSSRSASSARRSTSPRRRTIRTACSWSRRAARSSS